MAHYDFCIWVDIELRASDPYDMILTLNYRIMSPTRIIADFRVSTRFYIFEHKNIFALTKRIFGFKVKNASGRKRAQKLSNFTSHIQKFMYIRQFQKYFT